MAAIAAERALSRASAEDRRRVIEQIAERQLDVDRCRRRGVVAVGVERQRPQQTRGSCALRSGGDDEVCGEDMVLAVQRPGVGVMGRQDVRDRFELVLEGMHVEVGRGRLKENGDGPAQIAKDVV